MTLRRVGSSEPVEVVAPDELARRKEAEWERYRRSHGLDQWEKRARRALQRGETITVPNYTGELWWFVRDVNGIDGRSPPQRSSSTAARAHVPLRSPEPLVLWDPGDENEAARVFMTLDDDLRPTRRRRAMRAA